MPRDIPIGNGDLLVTFDHDYILRDLYWPYVGQENHVRGQFCRFGVWADGRMTWLNEAAWRKTLTYEPGALVTRVEARHDGLGLALVCRDCVDINHNLVVRRVEVHNLLGGPREVRLFWHHDLDAGGVEEGNTAYYDPERRAVIHYRGAYWFLIGARTEEEHGVHQFATGSSRHLGAQGTWCDAEDGLLSGNAVAQGCVDSVIALHLNVRTTARCYSWIAVGRDSSAVEELDRMIEERGPEGFLTSTRAYWTAWVEGEQAPFDRLDPEVRALYTRSLLILRSQIDNRGAIMAANDTDVLQFNRDTYSYLWPRDGALVAHALDLANQPDLARRFYAFCETLIDTHGYFLHKYNPDGSLGSSWHPWTDEEGRRQLPIQEDETALVLVALWEHFRRYRDLDFIRSLHGRLIHPAGEFLADFRGPEGLPQPSYDLWEERHGIHTFTVATVWAGLQAARGFAETLGYPDQAARYHAAAREVRQAARRHLFDPRLGRFVRRLYREQRAWQVDEVPDSSLAALFQFGMFPPDDPAVVATMAAVERELWCQTDFGGVARYWNDHYHQRCHDLTVAPGNPWVICTLWLADWYIARGGSDNLERARALLRRVASWARPSGVLPEQFNPLTGAPLSVAPLTWSHATFVTTVHRYMARLAEMSTASTAAQDIDLAA